MESKNSDYDIRFVYIRDIKDYLRIGKLPDVIEHMKGEMDFVGFDIFKFTKLLLNSNPNIINWLKCKLIYSTDGTTKELFRKFIEQKFNPIALYHHYRSMCKQNYLKYLKTSALMTHKKYLYCMRGLVNAKYVEQNHELPPIDFKEALSNTKIDDSVRKKLIEVIELKKEGFEEIKVSKIHLFESYIEQFLEEETKIESRRLVGYTKIQNYLWKLLL